LLFLFLQVTGLTFLAVGWYSAKRGTGIMAKYVEARLGKPSLVRETSRITPIEFVKHPIAGVKQWFRRGEDPLKGIVLNVG
jgi:ATPase family AAA domain-containing protein 3A/B